MKIIAIFFLLLLCNKLPAQNLVPPFVPQDIQLAVPAFLPGLMNDPAATLKNDTLYYKLTGVIFRTGYQIYAGSKNLSHADPFETLFELVDAYIKKDKERIAKLYNASSSDAVQRLLNGPEGTEFLNYVNSTAHGSLELFGAFEYQNGYLTFVRDNDGKVHPNYMVKEGTEYKLSAFNDSKVTSWNLNMYFSAMPLPMVPLRTSLRKESMASSDSMMIQTTVPANTPYVALFTGKAGETSPLMVIDNSKADLNLTKGRVSFYVPGYLFPREGANAFYLAAFNYPVSFVSRNFFVKEAEHSINIHK